MSLEQFKTQILLLHSEQDTLDSLSTGFNDRYTVHCATSGSEALNTLGETDIDVIVTAQDLPGMSGLDALREARKRSPDTIGIILAGNNGEGVEALVGAQEVFQVVRGGVTPESLRSLIDNATRQNRLMALAESANDTTAAMDEPSEHIIMETSENGSAIISDGTGRMPALNPDKVSPNENIGSRAVDVLVLTKDEEFLTTIRESSRGMHTVIYANTLAQADDAVRKQKVGVAVVDAAMVGDNVEKLTMHLRTISPRLVAIVAGRRDDGEMLMDLINRGKVYRFLLKPVSPGRARLAVEASVKHHLEAPDAAFRTVGSAPAAKAAPQPVKAQPPKAQPKPPPKPEPRPAAKAAAPVKATERPPQKPAAKTPPQAAREQSMSVPTIKVEPRPVPVDSSSMMDDALGDAFGGDDKSFTETMTGIIHTVGETLSAVTSRKKEKPDDPAPDVAATVVATPVEVSADSSGSGGSIFGNPKLLGVGAVAVLALLGVGWWMYSAPDETAAIEEVTSSAPPVAATKPAVEPPAAVDTAAGVDDLVAEARLAAAAGQLFNPPGSNAIELYMDAAAAAPDDITIATELAATIEQTLSMAESSLLQRQDEDAAAALQRVAMADPANARLPFLEAQLAQMQLRDQLDASRLAIREGRYQDAEAALDSARAIGADASDEIAVVAGELSAALSEQRVDDVLAKANARLDEGKLTAPSNDNARYYFELAMSNDPGNSAARQGLNVIASKLVLQARAEIDAGQFDAAEILLADARRLDPGSSELAASTTALAAARDRRAQELRAEAQRAADEKAAAEKLAAEQAAAEQLAIEQAAAAKLAAEQAAAAKLAAEQAAAEKLAADQAAAEQRAAEQAAAEKLAAQQQAAQQVAPAQPAPAQPAPAQESAGPAANGMRDVTNDAPVAASTLERIKYVAPRYPRAAQRRNLTGWVDVIFTVDIDGTVTNISVRDSDPGITFVNAAVSAIEDWEFAPVIENGTAIQKRAAVRMTFAME